MSNIQTIRLPSFVTDSGATYEPLDLHYQHFGREFQEAPVVLVNHSLTGDASVTGKNGWWKEIVGDGKVIDTTKYAVVAFNVPGNGALGQVFDSYKDFHAGDVAKIFYLGLENLGIQKLYANIGGSVGGGIVWELAALYPNLVEHVIPVATSWQSSGWVIANTYLQSRILQNSSQPLRDARIHAMMTYRNPLSIKQRFNREFNFDKNIFQVESWLLGHGDKIASRYKLKAYILMNHLLGSIDISRNKKNLKEVVRAINSNIHIFSIDTDQLFTLWEDEDTINEIKGFGKQVNHYVIKSIHGHDAFLIEYPQIEKLLKPIF